MTTLPPAQIGRYRIERELGRGTMGVVYEAEDTALGRKVALKTFGTMEAIGSRDREAFEKRFLSEARISATVEHEHVVGVYDVGRDFETGLLFIALEFVRGETLADRLAHGPIPWKEAASHIAKVARALHVAHAQHVVHRDIKPANIMINTAGEPKVMDFGIAKASASQLTLAGQVFGTPAYMSPEQASGEEVDGRSDIFSLGGVLYELVTNTRPFEGPNVPATLSRILREEPRPASALADVPKALDTILTRALCKQRERRYESAAQLAADLESLLDGGSPNGPALIARDDRPAAASGPLATLPMSSIPVKRAPAPTSTLGGAQGIPSHDAAEDSPKKRLPLLIVVLGAFGLAALGMLRIQQRGANEAGTEPTPVRTLPTTEPDAPSSPSGDAPVEATPPAAIPTPTTAVLSMAGAGETVNVTMELRHPFASGSLRVKVDEAIVLADRLSGLPIRDAGVTTGYNGRFRTDLKVPVGTHRITIEVRTGPSEFIESLRVQIRPDDPRRLVGVIDKTLTLTFE